MSTSLQCGLNEDKPLSQVMEGHTDMTLLQQLTVEEKVSLLAGKNMWETADIPSLGIPSLKTTDGPAGVRGESWSGGTRSTLIPCGISLGATFDPNLIQQVGEILGLETNAKGAQILLGPTINISRSPFGGRNFENFGEDPFLTGKMAIGIVNGVQSQGVGSCVKHFVANDQEFLRFNVDVRVDQRTLREIYLRPFEMSMAAKPWALMSSYNKVNGQHSDMNTFLLKTVLRDEWKYEGLTISDWGGTNDTVQSVIAGLDVEMPGPPARRGNKLLEKIKAGEISPSALDESVARLLSIIGRWKSAASGNNPLNPEPVANGSTSQPAKVEEMELDLPEQRELLRKVASSGIVLLKNNGILPLDAKKIQKLAVIGPNALTPTVGGDGSAALNPYYITTPLESIREMALEINPNIEITHAPGCLTHGPQPLLPVSNTLTIDKLQQGFQLEFYAGYGLQGPCVETKTWDSSFVFFFSDDDVPDSLKGSDYSLRLSCFYRADRSGQYCWGLSNIGKAKLYVDDKLLIDNTAWTKAGGTMMNCGSEEIKAVLDLTAGQEYKVVVEYDATSPPLEALDNTLFPYLAGVRVGVLPPIDEDALLSEAESLAADADVVVFVGGMNNDWEKEGEDRVTLSLPLRLNELILRVTSANSQTIVVNQSACAVQMSDWAEKTAAIVQAWYQGQECGNAIADVLLGKANPSGKLPITFPRKIEDHPTYGFFPGNLEGKYTEYKEGILVGYRWFEAHQIPPLFEFGFGLSYTTFDLKDVRVEGEISQTSSAFVKASIQNVGNMTGAEVVQVYLVTPMSPKSQGSSTPMFVKALKGFQKVELEPGKAGEISIKLGLDEVEWYDVESEGGWRVDSGSYDLHIGLSSRDIKAYCKLNVAVDLVGPEYKRVK